MPHANLLRTKRIWTFLIVIALLLSGCTGQTPPAQEPLAQSYPLAQDYQEITHQQLDEMMTHEDIFLIDVREPIELEETGYIPGALNVPLGELEDNLCIIPEDKIIVIYCRTDNRSAEAAEMLASNNFQNVYYLKGGISEWPYNKTLGENKFSP